MLRRFVLIGYVFFGKEKYFQNSSTFYLSCRSYFVATNKTKKKKTFSKSGKKYLGIRVRPSSYCQQSHQNKIFWGTTLNKKVSFFGLALQVVIVSQVMPILHGIAILKKDETDLSFCVKMPKFLEFTFMSV